MSTRLKQFLMPKQHLPSWHGFARRPSTARLAGIAPTSRRYLFFWARNAIYHSLRALDIHPGETVLVPAYICAAAVEPIEAYGAKAVFYGVERNCIPDFSDLEARIDGGTRAILAVHYFGFPCGIRRIRDICDQHGLSLIEDCAHVLQGKDGDQLLGTFGEASIFSWRKFLPIYDGGELVLNRWQRDLMVDWRKESFLFTLREVKNLLEGALPGTFASALQNLRFSKPSSAESAASQGPLPRSDGGGLHVDPNSDSFDEKMANSPISRLSRLMLEHCEVERIIAKRRGNYGYLQHRLAELRGIRLLFDDLPAGACPWVLPLFLEEIPNGHLFLRKLGIPAVTWGGVRHPGICSAEFPAADFLYENLIFLPIHQDLREKDLDRIIEGVKRVLANGPSDLARPQFA
jgi:perosamine synthetase